MTRGRRAWSATVAAAAVVAVLGLGIVGGVALAPSLTGSDRAPSTGPQAPGPVAIGFSQDMIVHHEQAVVMSQLVRGRADPSIAALAGGIESNQLLEIGQLQGFLAIWDAPVLPAGPAMSWMDAGAHGHGAHHAAGSAMPGMATQDELEALRTASGGELDVLFLQLMLRHHQGGLPMMTEAAERAEVPAVRNLAARLRYGQIEESQAMLQMLAAHGARPLPAPGA